MIRASVSSLLILSKINMFKENTNKESKMLRDRSIVCAVKSLASSVILWSGLSIFVSDSSLGFKI